LRSPSFVEPAKAYDLNQDYSGLKTD